MAEAGLNGVVVPKIERRRDYIYRKFGYSGFWLSLDGGKDRFRTKRHGRVDSGKEMAQIDWNHFLFFFFPPSPPDDEAEPMEAGDEERGVEGDVT